MKINVNHLGQNKIYEIEVGPTTTVDVLKLKLSATHNLNYNLIKLSLKNNPLKNDSATMQSLGVSAGTTFVLESGSAMPSKSQV